MREYGVVTNVTMARGEGPVALPLLLATRKLGPPCSVCALFESQAGEKLDFYRRLSCMISLQFLIGYLAFQ